MTKSNEFGCGVDVNRDDLPQVVLEAEFATVHGLSIAEINQADPNSVAILHIFATIDFKFRTAIFCLMLVGTDATSQILWASCVQGHTKDGERQELFDAPLIPQIVLGKTAKVAARLYGMRLEPETT